MTISNEVPVRCSAGQSGRPSRHEEGIQGHHFLQSPGPSDHAVLWALRSGVICMFSRFEPIRVQRIDIQISVEAQLAPMA